MEPGHKEKVPGQAEEWAAEEWAEEAEWVVAAAAVLAAEWVLEWAAVEAFSEMLIHLRRQLRKLKRQDQKPLLMKQIVLAVVFVLLFVRKVR